MSTADADLLKAALPSWTPGKGDLPPPDLEGVRAALAAGANPNLPVQASGEPLLRAVVGRRTYAVRNPTPRTPDYLPVVVALLDAGADPMGFYPEGVRYTTRAGIPTSSVAHAAAQGDLVLLAELLRGPPGSERRPVDLGVTLGPLPQPASWVSKGSVPTGSGFVGAGAGPAPTSSKRVYPDTSIRKELNNRSTPLEYVLEIGRQNVVGAVRLLACRPETVYTTATGKPLEKLVQKNAWIGTSETKRSIVDYLRKCQTLQAERRPAEYIATARSIAEVVAAPRQGGPPPPVPSGSVRVATEGPPTATGIRPVPATDPTTPGETIGDFLGLKRGGRRKTRKHRRHGKKKSLRRHK